MSKKPKNTQPQNTQQPAAAPREPPLEEQLMHRQSAPRATAQEKLDQLQPGGVPSGAVNGFDVLEQPIGREQVLEAMATLQKYKEGKANLEQRIIDNEQWYKLRHWECLRKGSKKNQVEPVSGWLFNCIANKHADAMDNFPSLTFLPREEGDKAEAELLSSIVPVILEQNNFEDVYSNVQDYKMKAGTGIYGIFWDASKLNGLGDIDIRKFDVLSLFWESGITDIQQSRNLFSVELRDNDLLEQEYPQLKGKLTGDTVTVSQYVHDDSVDTTRKSAVVDWYYKKMQGGKVVLHFCKFVNDTVLFATENERAPQPDPRTGQPLPTMAETGLYDHGMYPFVFDPLFSVEGSPCGFSYIDIGKSAQEYIDRGNQAIMQNMLANSRPRHFIRNDGSVNEAEYGDLSKDFVHVDSGLGQDSILPIQGKPLSSIYVEVINNKIDELKETTGNRDISTGGTSSGVTAASAIAAMQEAGSKLSRDHNKASYRATRKVGLMVQELMRQFYDMPRSFRILGENGTARFVSYTNAGLRPQHQGDFLGQDMGYRLPVFDIEITAQKQSPYSKLSQNELALQFYGAGFFNPQMADQALACLDMMDFDRKEFIMQKIAQNGGMYQQMLLMQQQMLTMARMVDQAEGSNLAEQIAAGVLGAPAPAMAERGTGQQPEQTEALGGKEGPREASSTRNARKRVAESTSPT